MPSLNALMKRMIFSQLVPDRAWDKLRALSLRGMNIGEGSHVADSGELWLLDQLVPHLQGPPTATVFDVGANVGLYSQAVYGRLQKDVRLFSFEPAAAPLAKLRASLGSIPNVEIVPLGLGDREEAVTLFTDPSNTSMASLYPRELAQFGIDLTHKETVALTTLDSFCASQRVDRIDLLKLDCEGHELRALAGGSSLLASGQIRAIQFEFGGCNIDSRTYFRDFHKLLSPQYHIYRILRTGLTKIYEYHERLEVFITTNFLALRNDHPLAAKW
jgi:FkbM family methyltransferase